MAGIFKAYDIRGIVGKELTQAMAYKIGRALVTFLRRKGGQCRNVVVGRDVRMHTEPLFAALVKGIREQGANVMDIGKVSTPMSYFANGALNVDASVMITASHNTAEWNGFKLCRRSAEPISGKTGLKDIERIVEQEAFAPTTQLGTLTRKNVLAAYAKHVAKFTCPKRPLHIAIDFANGMGIWEAQALKGLMTWDALYGTPDGWFPNHAADPLTYTTLKDVQTKIRDSKGHYAFGVAFDGDADRAGFLDEKGRIIPGDLITALIAQDLLEKHKGAKILYDVRSSWAVKEAIEKAGGTAIACPVGHSGIKQTMRKEDAVFAGEVSAHYYFRDNYVAESQAMAILTVASIVEKKGKPLSELIRPLRKYCPSGEINSHVNGDPQDVIKNVLDKVLTKEKGGKVSTLDGVSVEFQNWWFNVRCSNTEPIVRLNLEAKSKALMTEKRDEVLAIIRG